VGLYVETQIWLHHIRFDGVIIGYTEMRRLTTGITSEKFVVRLFRRTSTNSAPKNVEKIWRLVHEDRQRTIKDIAAIVNVSYGTVQTILTCDLNMHRVAAKFVPRLLTPEQKEHRVAIC